MTRRSSRREFVKRSALAGLGFWTLGDTTSVGYAKRPNEQLQFACIGVGGKGDSDSSHVGEFGKVVAICDIDENTLANRAKKYPDAVKFHDFRELLDKMGDKIDAVTVSTPDHTHAVAAVRAMRLKKHVYVQKPLTWSVQEARLMRNVAKEMGVATQMGNQGTASDGLRRGVEIVQSGAIGPIKEVHIWTNRPLWPQAPEVTSRGEASEAPRHVHWNDWLGPAPERPYVAIIPGVGKQPYHPHNWRGWRDFGTGALGDMACHTTNLAFQSLDLGLPVSVRAESSEVNPETYQQWATITYQFAGRGKLPPVTLVWREGNFKNGKKTDPQNLPPRELFHGEGISSSGSLFVGDQGTIYSPGDNGTNVLLLPKDKFKDYKDPEKRLHRWSKDDDLAMKEEWVRAIRGGEPAMSNFQYAAVLTETLLLGNAAVAAGKELKYDGSQGKFTNVEEANKLLGRTPRKGWEI
jgi:predicted dehydrogenase